MKSKTLRQLLLYNYRYIFAYFLIIVFVAYFLCWQLGSIGPGISQQESVIAALHTDARASLRQPLTPLFSKLQILSLYIFGVNTYSIRVPSIIVGVATLLLLYKILKKWFGKPTALLSIAFIATADWFLFTARHATGAIEMSFWIVVAIFSIMKILERKHTWGLALALALTSLVFVPFGIYAALTLLIGVVSCRVIRERVTQAPLPKKLLMYTIPLIGLSFLGYSVYRDTAIIKSLLGVSTGLPSPLEYVKNIVTNGLSIIGVVPATNPVNGPQGVFFVRFFELTFVLFGAFMFWKTRINRLNVIVISLSIVLFISSGLSVDSGASSLLIIPFSIFITAGLRYFIHRWQKTFPKNPYARMLAFIPIVVLLLLTALQHQQSYFVLWPRQTGTANAFSYNLRLSQAELNTIETDKTCSVATTDQTMILLLQASHTACKPTFKAAASVPKLHEVQIIQPSLVTSASGVTNIRSRALVSPSSTDSVRWIVQTRTD